jgi:hypothetical protein
MQSEHDGLWLHGDGALVEASTIYKKRADNTYQWAAARAFFRKYICLHSVATDLKRHSALTVTHLLPGSQAGSSDYLLAHAFYGWDLGYTHEKNFLPMTILATLCALGDVPKDIKSAYKNTTSFAYLDLYVLIQQALLSAEPKRDVFLVIDAIDEIQLRKTKLQALDIVKRVGALNERLRGCKIRIIAFSRYDDDVADLCSKLQWQRQDIPKDKVADDIEYAVRCRIDRISEELGRHVLQRICGRRMADFRWASISMENLESSELESVTVDNVDGILRDLSDDLGETYDRIICRVQNTKQRFLLLVVLQIAVFASGQTSIHSIVDAAATLPDKPRRLLYNGAARLAPKTVIKTLNGLVQPSYDSLSNSLLDDDVDFPMTLKHFSVAEHLLRAPAQRFGASTDVFNYQYAQQRLMLRCFAYLLHCQESTTTQYRPFQTYAARAWHLHAAAYLESINAAKSLEVSDDYSSLTRHSENELCLTPVSAFAMKVRNVICAPLLYPADIVESLSAEIKKAARERLEESHVSNLLKDLLPRTLQYSDKVAERVSSTISSIYSTLDPIPSSTRLLLLEPSADPHSPLIGNLVNDSLDNHPQYIALAHNWGEWRGLLPLYIRNGDGLVELPIWVELHEALVHVRHDQETKVLWIDSVCINMADLSERVNQIQMMKEIFATATEVLAWLGDSRIIDYNLAELTTQIKFCRGTNVPATRLRLTAGIVRSLNRLFRLPFWQRRWIYQEMYLARKVTVQAGAHTMPLEELMKLGSSDSVGRPVLAIPSFSLLGRLKSPNLALKLPELLFMLKDKHCTIPVDSFYSVVGMLSGQEMQTCSAMVDYSKSPHTIYLDVAAYIIKAYKCLDILSINHVSTLEENLDSWPPHWDCPLYDHPLAARIFQPLQPLLFQPWKMQTISTPASVDTKDHAGVLSLDAICIDRVANILLHLDHADTFDNLMKAAQRCDARWREESQRVFRVRLIRTMCEDRVMDDQGIFRRMTDDDVEQAFKRLDTSEGLRDAAIQSRGNRTSRSLFRTRHGQMGNAPNHTSWNDKIFVIPEAPHALYILRPPPPVIQLATE